MRWSPGGILFLLKKLVHFNKSFFEEFYNLEEQSFISTVNHPTLSLYLHLILISLLPLERDSLNLVKFKIPTDFFFYRFCKKICDIVE
jgi:hypothetical protein